MFSLAILALFGGFVIGSAFDLFDSGSDGNTSDDDTEEAVSREGDTIVGTEGDDDLTANGLYDLLDGDIRGVNVVDLAGGNDTYQSGPHLAYDVTVRGGEGDDNLASSGQFENIFEGGDGDDTIDAVLLSSAYGDAGDDVITYDQGDGSSDGLPPALDGGEGDDTITVSEVIGWNNAYDTTAVEVFGGEGNDVINLDLTDNVLEESDWDAEYDITDPGDESQVHLKDFNPREDSLSIDISSFEESGHFAYQGAELNPTGEGMYTLDLDFFAAAANNTFTVSVLIESEETVELSDIEFVTAAAAA